MKLARSLVALLTLAGCGASRWYQLPITRFEGQLMVPALIASAQAQNLQAFRGASGAVAYLEDNTMLSWQDAANHTDFILYVALDPSVAPTEHDAKFQAAKSRADQIWQGALQQRAGMVPPVVTYAPAPVVQAPPPGASLSIGVPGMSLHVQAPPPPGAVAPQSAPAAAPAQTGCRQHGDCAPNTFCKDRGDGALVCMGQGLQGAYCQTAADCAAGLVCRATYQAVATCQP